LWRFALPGTREIQAAVFSYPYDFEVWDRLMDPVMIPTLRQEGIAIEGKHFKDITELLEVGLIVMKIGNTYVPVCNLPYTLASDAGHQMCRDLELGIFKNPELKAILADATFAATYYDTATARVFSLRSLEGGADVSKIAQQYGGGGHEHAAGFSVDRDHILAKI